MTSKQRREAVDLLRDVLLSTANGEQREQIEAAYHRGNVLDMLDATEPAQQQTNAAPRVPRPRIVDILEETTRDLVVILDEAPGDYAEAIDMIEDALRLDGSGSAYPMALETILEARIIVPQPIIDRLRIIGVEHSDHELVEDADDLEAIASK